MKSFALALLLAACGPRAPAPAPTPGEPFGRLEGTLDGHAFLKSDSARARAAGAEESEVIAVGAGSAGDRISSLFALPESDCGLVIARGNDSVEDVDLFVYGDDGTVFGSDEAPDKTPSLLVCPPHPRRLFAVARLAAGHGVVAIGVQRVSAARAEAVGRSLLPSGGRDAAEAAVATFPRLNEQVSSHHRTLGGSWREVRRAGIPLDPRVASRLSVAIAKDRCISVLVLPASDVSHLDVTLLEANGRIAGRGRARGRERFLVACAPERTDVTVEVRPRAGQGTGVVVVSESRDGHAALAGDEAFMVDLTAPASADDWARELDRRLDAAGYGGSAVVSQGTLPLGTRTSVALALGAGCSRVDVVGGRPLHGLLAQAWTDDGQLLASARGVSQATLFLCGAPRPSLELEALQAPGPHRVIVRPDPDAPAVFLQHPLAAHRLLGFAMARGVGQRGTHFGGARALRVTSSQRVSIPITVPIARCVDVSASVGGGGRGLTLRLLEEPGGKELDRSHGAHVVALRACALDRGRTLLARAELSLDAGESDALLATRQLTPQP